MIDVFFYGQACFKIKGKSTSIVFDPYNAEFTGLGKLKLEGDIVCVSHAHEDHNNFQSVKASGRPEDREEEAKGDNGQAFVVNGPGEYEKLGVNILGISSFHDDKGGSQRGKNTIYNVKIDDVNFVHLGDFGQKKLTQDQVEELSSCDVLFIPVGGVYTIEARDAPDIISQIEPKIIIPMHYKLPGLKFELSDVSAFLAVMGKEAVEPLSKLSISKEKLPEEPEVVVLSAQS